MPWIVSRFAQKCKECGDDYEEGARIYYNGQAYCEVCGPQYEKIDKEIADGKKKQGRTKPGRHTPLTW